MDNETKRLGYVISKLLVMGETSIEDENSLTIILNQFPKMKDDFINGKDIMLFNSDNELISFLEDTIEERLKQGVEITKEKAKKYPDNSFDFFKKSGSVQTYHFKDKEYELITFADDYNVTTISLLNLYNSFNNDKYGTLLISPKDNLF